MLLGASAFVLNNQGKVLLIKREDLGVWALPGGMKEDKESFETACLRELHEETGIKSEIKGLACINIRVKKPLRDLNLVFTCDGLQVVPNTGCKEVKDIGWFDIENLPKPILQNTTNVILTIHGKRGKEPAVVENTRYEYWVIKRFLVHKLRKNLKKVLSSG